MSDRLFNATMSALGRRMTRRSVLAKMAVAGSAMAVAPVRYMLKPGTALGVIRCGNCTPGARCCDGWTTFCCVINNGSNSCPANTFMGGWWKCTNYTGSGACSAEGVRYYVDCNRTPTTSCPHGCHCANENCRNRSTCCNVFRYGQCNAQVQGVTEVVCRMITCDNPCQIFVNCNCTYFQENATCSHEAGCL